MTERATSRSQSQSPHDFSATHEPAVDGLLSQLQVISIPISLAANPSESSLISLA